MQKVFVSKNFQAYASIFVLALIALFSAYIFWGLMLPRKDFYNELWGPAYLLVHGQSPYNTASLNPVLPAAWLPMSIGFFFPLGWLPETAALQVWYIFTILELSLIVYIALGKEVDLGNTSAAALLVFFFPLTLNHINLGQFSITVTLGWILAVQTFEFYKNSKVLQDWIPALLIALALSKPHLGLAALLGMSYHHYAARGGLRAMFFLWARIFTACLILCIPLFVAYPNWIPDMLASMGRNGYWSFPSLYVLFDRFLGTVIGYSLAGIVTIIVLGINFVLWKKLPIRNALYWSLAIAPLTTPYVGSWDFVVIFPLLISTYAQTNWKQKIFIWVSYLIAWGLMARIQMMASSHNHYFWWVPIWFIVTVILVNWKKDIKEN